MNSQIILREVSGTGSRIVTENTFMSSLKTNFKLSFPICTNVFFLRADWRLNPIGLVILQHINSVQISYL